MRISGRQSVLIHPADASRDAINDGDLVRLGNDQFYLELDATITEHVNQGEVLVINSFSGNPVNKIMRRDSLTTFVSVKRA
jgi:anaerobic selenocysteine-containing dehydrogenase